MRLTAIGTSDEVDPMQIFLHDYGKVVVNQQEFANVFFTRIRRCLLSIEARCFFSSEQIHPMRLTAIGTSDEVDPMQISQRFLKTRSESI